MNRLTRINRAMFRWFRKRRPDTAERLLDVSCAIVWNDKPQVQSGVLPQWVDLPEEHREELRRALAREVTGEADA